MSGHLNVKTNSISDYVTGALVGQLGADGKEYAHPGLTADSSGTPGAGTQHTTKGRVAVAAGQSQVTVTNRLVNAASTVLAQISQSAADATGTSVVRVAPAAGSFVITLNAAATAATVVDWALFGQLAP